MDKLNLNIIIYPFVALASIYGIALNKEKIVYKYLAFILIFLSMIRFDTGYDYYWYYAVSKKQYMYYPRIENLYIQLEPGIKKIVDIVRESREPQYFFLITALITFGFIYRTIYRDSKSPLISLALFMFLQMGFFNGNAVVMQACALGICFFSYRYCYEKKYLIYFSLIIFAMYFFHNSAIICLIFILIPRKKISLKLWAMYVIILIILLKGIIPRLVAVFFPQYFYLLRFSNSVLYGKRDITICLLVSISIFSLRYVKNFFRKTNNNGYIYFLENIFIGGSVFSVISLYSIGGFFPFRVGIYALITIFIIIGEYLSRLNIKNVKNIKILLIILLNCYFIIGIYKKNYIYLDKVIYRLEDGSLNKRPNSYGFRIFFNKTEADMHKYLPHQKGRSWK